MSKIVRVLSRLYSSSSYFSRLFAFLQFSIKIEWMNRHNLPPLMPAALQTRSPMPAPPPSTVGGVTEWGRGNTRSTPSTIGEGTGLVVQPYLPSEVWEGRWRQRRYRIDRILAPREPECEFYLETIETFSNWIAAQNLNQSTFKLIWIWIRSPMKTRYHTAMEKALKTVSSLK